MALTWCVMSFLAIADTFIVCTLFIASNKCDDLLTTENHQTGLVTISGIYPDIMLSWINPQIQVDSSLHELPYMFNY